MANYYIGYVSAFIRNDKGNLDHYFEAKTLTDSSINISVSSEEIRGGEGAQLLGRFFHTSVFNLSMTDALFDLKYLAAQVGSDVINASGSKMEHEELETVNNTLKGVPIALVKDQNPVVWVKFDDGSYMSFEAVSDDNGKTYKIKDTEGFLTGATKICVTYFADVDNCRQIIVNANYQPSELTVYLRAKLFSGDACKPSKGQAIGEIVVEIPRFQLDGTIDLAMAMASPATFALNGSALASGCDCDGKMWYAKITEVMYNAEDYTKYSGIIILGADELAVGDKIVVYAVGNKQRPKLMSSDEYKITTNPETGVVDDDGKILKAGTVTVTVEDTIKMADSAVKTATATIA